MSCITLSPHPQNLAFQGISPMCGVCDILLCPGHFFLQSSCLQRLPMPVVGSVLSLSKVDIVLPRCMRICLQSDTFSCSCRDQGCVGGAHSFNKMCLGHLQGQLPPLLPRCRPHKAHQMRHTVLARSSEGRDS